MRNPIRKAVMVVVNNLVAEKEEEFRVGSLQIADQTTIAIDNIKEEGKAKKDALAKKCVNDVLGKIT